MSVGGGFDPRKLFVGNLGQDVREGELRDYFSQFGDIEQVAVMEDRNTGRSRGFAFVSFKEEASVVAVLQHEGDHMVNGRRLEVKRASPRDDRRGGGRGRGRGRGRGDRMGGPSMGGLPAAGMMPGYPAAAAGYAGYGYPYGYGMYGAAGYTGYPGYAAYTGAYPGYDPSAAAAYYGMGAVPGGAPGTAPPAGPGGAGGAGGAAAPMPPGAPGAPTTAGLTAMYGYGYGFGAPAPAPAPGGGGGGDPYAPPSGYGSYGRY